MGAPSPGAGSLGAGAAARGLGVRAALDAVRRERVEREADSRWRGRGPERRLDEVADDGVGSRLGRAARLSCVGRRGQQQRHPL